MSSKKSMSQSVVINSSLSPEEQQLLSANLPSIENPNKKKTETTIKTHIFLVIAFISTVLASGPLTSFPTLEPLLVDAGIFYSLCPENYSDHADPCKAQEYQLTALYNASTGIGLALALFMGLAFDKFGARVVGVAGAIGVTVGMVVLWASTLHPNVNWLIFIGFPLTDASGMLNSMAINGFLWHYPNNQAFIIGIGSGSYQVSGIMAIVLGWIIQEFHISLGIAFLVFAAMALISAIMTFFVIPSQSEFFERAEEVVGYSPSKDGKNVIIVTRDAFDVLFQKWRDNALFLFYVISSYCFLAMWIGQYFFFMQVLLNDTDFVMFLVQLAAYFSAGGAFVTPVFGFIMDKIGINLFLLGLVSCIGMFTCLITLPNNAAQIVCLVIGNCVTLTWQTFSARWMVRYISPDLIGTGGGIISLTVGIVQIILNVSVPYIAGAFTSGVNEYIFPLIFFGGLSVAAGLTLSLWMYKMGLPKSPPQSRNQTCCFPDDCCCHCDICY